jgi:tetratricopeptide (TPR) repeat protein
VDAHSLYLESLAELGAPGAVMVVIALGALLVAALAAPFRQVEVRARGAAVGCAAAFAVFCVSAGVDWMWESTAVASLAIVLGTAAAAGPSLPRPRRRRTVRMGLTALALVALLAQLPVLVGASEIRSSQAAVARGALVEALADADAAVEAVPWAATAPLQRGLVLERVGQLAQAERATAQAIRNERDNWELWLILGRVRAERGRLVAALAAVREARRLNPRSPLFARGVARRLAGAGG